MKICRFHKTITLFIILCLVKDSFHFDVSSTDIIGEAEVMNKAQEIFQNIKNSDFVSTVKSISKWGLPLLNSIGFFAKVIKAAFPSESKELKYMKEQFALINNRMDVVDEGFDEVKRLIDWNVVKISYSKYEIAINVLQDKIQSLIEVPPAAKRMQIDLFMMTFEQIYHNAVEHIYSTHLSVNKIYSENLIEAARKYSQDDVPKIEKFFMGNLKIILKGLEVETFYMENKNYTHILDSWRNMWGTKIQNLMDIMTKTIAQIKANFDVQSKNDMEQFNVKNQGKSVDQYAQDLYKMLTTKFPYRLWLVAVYDPLDSKTDHDYTNCKTPGSVTQMQSRGFNVLVNSLPPSAPSLPMSRLSSVCRYIPLVLRTKKGPAEKVLIKYVRPLVDCKSTMVGLVVRSKSAKTVIAPAGHTTSCRWAGHYTRFFMIHKTLDIVFLG